MRSKRPGWPRGRAHGHVRTAIEHARGMHTGHAGVEGHARGRGAGHRNAVRGRRAHGVYCEDRKVSFAFERTVALDSRIENCMWCEHREIVNEPHLCCHCSSIQRRKLHIVRQPARTRGVINLRNQEITRAVERNPFAIAVAKSVWRPPHEVTLPVTSRPEAKRVPSTL